MPIVLTRLRAMAAALALGLMPAPLLAAAVAEKPAPAAPAPTPGPDLVAANPGGASTVTAVLSYGSPAGALLHQRLATFARQNPGIRIVVRPVATGGPLTEFLAKAAYVAERQGRFLAFHEAAVTAPQAHTWYSLRDSAPVIGLDWQRFQADFADPKVAEAVRANAAFSEARKIAAPPALVAGERVFAGPLEKLNLAQVAAAAGGGASVTSAPGK